MTDERFFNDDPVDGTASSPDLLGRETYARHAVGVLQRVRRQSDSGVLALIGSWGSGKSSVLTMVMGLLAEETDEAWSVAELNPWLYSDLESLTLALFSEIREALPKGDRWSTARTTLAGYARAISPIGKLGSLVGPFDASGPLKGIGDRIEGDTSASATKRRVEEALREAGRPVLVVMDDLDRLMPDELLLVFKLVRLVGRLPNVHYLISYDERTLLDVLRRSDLVGGEASRAREFLEKIVQVRLDLPAFRERDAGEMVERALSAVLGAHGLGFDDAQVRRFSAVYFGHLQDRLSTPRAVKRFFAQVDASLGELVQDVDVVDFVVVTFLRTMEPGLYALLSRHRGELTGAAFMPSGGDRIARWRELVRGAGVAAEHVEAVLRILGTLFPAVGRDLESFESVASEAAHARLGVGSEDYFDRYFTSAVPDDDMSEAAFDRALAQVPVSTGVEYAEFLVRLRGDTHRVTRRIRQRIDRGDTLPCADLLVLLAVEYGSYTAPAGVLGLVSAEASVRFLAPLLLGSIPEDERAVCVGRMARTPGGTALAAITLGRVIVPEGGDVAGAAGPGLDAWARDARGEIVGACRLHLAHSATGPAVSLSDRDVELLLLWQMFMPTQVRAWVREQLDAGTWGLLDLVIRLAPEDITYPDSAGALLRRADDLVGLDSALQELTTCLDAAAPDPSATGTSNPIADERRTRVLNILRNCRNSRRNGE
ncbi:hypothetical protein B4N89_46340 [Embleya scabrispora]|uniref:KAP NTPase domain-containing protein n=1 Tax=Embleya scabrispora TaxID=159449 RepID=A0A1T3NI13_9ACTN|nr:P-loop NTPase fold protein [Embleya scabrispora]OPC76469.1 hypothetical protein B4N89_46340 [Embleya scabrispora]